MPITLSVERFCFGFVAIPLCVEVIEFEFGLEPYPSLCSGDCCFGLVPYLLCRGGCVGERSGVLLSLYL